MLRTLTVVAVLGAAHAFLAPSHRAAHGAAPAAKTATDTRLAKVAAAAPATIATPKGVEPVRFRISPHLVLPAASYAGLGLATAGSLRVLSMATSSAWFPFALLTYTIGLPVGLLTTRLASAGGPGIAKAMGGKPADGWLTNLAHEAATAVGVPPPEHVFEISRQEPNAFAASGFGARAPTVAVTRGLRELLSADEMSAVLAHEMGHLRHRDVARNMHVAIAVAGLGGIYEAGRTLLRSSSSSSSSSKSKSKDDDDSGGGAGAGVMLMGLGLGSQAVAHLVQLSASRGAELKADLTAAEAYGAQSLVSALRKIDAAARAPGRDDLRTSAEGRALAFAMISDGPSPREAEREASPKQGTRPSSRSSTGRNGGTMVKRAFAQVGRALRTHPPLDERIEALEKAAVEGRVTARRPRESSFYSGTE